MSGHENVMGFPQGNDSTLNCPSSGLSTSVSEMAISSVSMAKPADIANPFLGSSTWDPLVSLNQIQTFGGSSMVSQNEFANSTYPLLLENQGMSSTSHLVQYMSDSNFGEMIPKIPSFESGNFSQMIGSFGQRCCSDLANTGYRPSYSPNKETGIERTQINGSQSKGEDSTPEQRGTGSVSNGNSRKRGLDYDSSFSPNMNAEEEALKDSSAKTSEVVKEKDEKKPKNELSSSVDLRGKQSGKQAKDNSQSGEATKENFIHVRARRGQATNSHSLAERVRREKISERMRLLQELVPGCNKITGKAVMLDEIINYVQSLQQQVEFLSMKLATVNPELNFDVERILSKDILQSRIGAGPVIGYGAGINSSHRFPSGSFQGPLTSMPRTSTSIPSFASSDCFGPRIPKHLRNGIRFQYSSR
ncbi:hypothetical protein L6164_024551 [Bauhinia variegata]|uniref:Uncharacterized protein n=1 Tax=Bauhinia variegata TaxID=167791 RepID=A0ACB9LXV3_BAUVA|nr:hypothetical protein L6164_024551 [Bauhinia variegata]